jgi:hypothetical protein
MELKRKLTKCEKRGYHDWEVCGVNGTLPEQEVELRCATKGCDAERTVDFVMRSSFEDD